MYMQPSGVTAAEWKYVGCGKTLKIEKNLTKHK